MVVFSSTCDYCDDHEFSCENNDFCIPEDKVCNKFPDCEDGSDEYGCPPCQDMTDDVADQRLPTPTCEEDYYMIFDLTPVREQLTELGNFYQTKNGQIQNYDPIPCLGMEHVYLFGKNGKI